MQTPIQITVTAPPRGAGSQINSVFNAQSFRGGFAWGSAPGEATIIYVGASPITTGALVTITCGGHYFAGVCVSDVAVSGSRGGTRELRFVDLRDFLTWDYTFCAFNMPERRLVNGVWKKRYWHIYPWDFDTYTKTFTDAPLPAWQMVNAILLGPTIGSPWFWDFTGNGFFPDGLLNSPVYSFDALAGGKRLDAALNEISSAGGLVFSLDARPFNLYRLVWMRKGYGNLPVFPDNSDERRIGSALSGNATNIRIVGDRNKYQVLNLDMKPDWQSAWEQFLVIDALAQDLYDNERDVQTGVQYKIFPDDPEHWKGAFAAKVRAMEITVAEYATLRNARRSADGDQFKDLRKFAGRSRMDMPAALYIQNLVFRAFRPNFTSITNASGNVIPLASLIIADNMLCRVTYDPVTGAMQDDITQLSDGNGLAVIKGWQFGQDFFKLVNPERITENFFTATRYWAAASFQIDDSAEGERFIILDAPAFTSENLLTTVDGLVVLNSQFTLAAPSIKAALTFEAEPFSYWKGTYPNVSRDRAEYVSGICKELTGTPGNYRELLYANGETASQQADRIAATLLLCQYIYFSGGYKLVWDPKKPASAFASPLSSVIDRVEIENGPQGAMLVTDWTTERQRNYFEPERDLERRTLQNTLYPGQADLKQKSMDYKRLLSAIKGMPREVFSYFMQFLTGNFDNGMLEVRVDDTTPIFNSGNGLTDRFKVGTPFFKGPTIKPVTGSTASTSTLVIYPPDVDPTLHTVFVGVTVREGEAASKSFYVRTQGETVARVQGPIAENDPIGINDAGYTAAYSTNGGYFIKNAKSVGVALQKISGNSIKLVRVRLTGPSNSSGDPVWLP